MVVRLVQNAANVVATTNVDQTNCRLSNATTPIVARAMSAQPVKACPSSLFL